MLEGRSSCIGGSASQRHVGPIMEGERTGVFLKYVRPMSRQARYFPREVRFDSRNVDYGFLNEAVAIYTQAFSIL